MLRINVGEELEQEYEELNMRLTMKTDEKTSMTDENETQFQTKNPMLKY